MSLEDLLRSYPRQRPPLTSAHERVFSEQYRLNRDGAGVVEGFAQRLERWMHRRVSTLSGGPILELGAGTLNHLRFEADPVDYDVIEPFRELYVGREATRRVRNFYSTIQKIPRDQRYRRVISIAVLEHMVNLPMDIAEAALRLNDDGWFQAGIPSEGGLLWGLAWRLSTGISYRLRTGLDYGVVMRHEHVNDSREILAIVKHLFKDVRLSRFPFPGQHCSFYTYLEATHPIRERCLAVVGQPRTSAPTSSARRPTSPGSRSGPTA